MINRFGHSWIVFSWQHDTTNLNVIRYIITISGGGRQANVTVDGSERSTNVTELHPGTEYMLRVIAVAEDGQSSPPSLTLLARTSIPGMSSMYIVCSIYYHFVPLISQPVAPSAPEDLTVNSIGSSWIAFSWRQGTVYSEITGHVVLVSGGGTEHNVTTDDARMSMNVKGLQSDTEYRLRIAALAMDGQMSPLSLVLTATTSLPGIPLPFDYPALVCLDKDIVKGSTCSPAYTGQTNNSEKVVIESLSW